MMQWESARTLGPCWKECRFPSGDNDGGFRTGFVLSITGASVESHVVMVQVSRGHVPFPGTAGSVLLPHRDASSVLRPYDSLPSPPVAGGRADGQPTCALPAPRKAFGQTEDAQLPRWGAHVHHQTPPACAVWIRGGRAPAAARRLPPHAARRTPPRAACRAPHQLHPHRTQVRKLDFTSPPLLATADWNFENERTITLRGAKKLRAALRGEWIEAARRVPSGWAAHSKLDSDKALVCGTGVATARAPLGVNFLHCAKQFREPDPRFCLAGLQVKDATDSSGEGWKTVLSTTNRRGDLHKYAGCLRPKGKAAGKRRAPVGGGTAGAGQRGPSPGTGPVAGKRQRRGASTSARGARAVPVPARPVPRRL